MGWSGKQETTRMCLNNNDNLYNRSRRRLYLLCLCRNIKLKKHVCLKCSLCSLTVKMFFFVFFYYIIITVLIETIRFPPYIGKFNFVIRVTFD